MVVTSVRVDPCPWIWPHQNSTVGQSAGFVDHINGDFLTTVVNSEIVCIEGLPVFPNIVHKIKESEVTMVVGEVRYAEIRVSLGKTSIVAKGA